MSSPTSPRLPPLLRRAIAAALLVSVAIPYLGCWAAPPAPPAGRALVLVGLDGFRADYLDTHAAPNLRALAARGVRAERMVPSFPSKTRDDRRGPLTACAARGRRVSGPLRLAAGPATGVA